MASLWQLDGPDQTWTCRELAERQHRLTDDPAGPIVMQATDEGRSTWVLLCRPGIAARVNGEPVPGVRVLAHRDEISVPESGVAYFSTDRAARIEPFRGGDPGAEPLNCPRCRQPIEAAQPSVRCPGCGVVHHETDESPCWTYGPACAVDFCDQRTAPQASVPWSPEVL
jgi:hypothetical protein